MLVWLYREVKWREEENSYMVYFISEFTHFPNIFFAILHLCTWFLNLYLLNSIIILRNSTKGRPTNFILHTQNCLFILLHVQHFKLKQHMLRGGGVYFSQCLLCTQFCVRRILFKKCTGVPFELDVKQLL
jgi:hypothetical protein